MVKNPKLRHEKRLKRRHSLNILISHRLILTVMTSDLPFLQGTTDGGHGDNDQQYSVHAVQHSVTSRLWLEGEGLGEEEGTRGRKGNINTNI